MSGETLPQGVPAMMPHRMNVVMTLKLFPDQETRPQPHAQGPIRRRRQIVCLLSA
jgi:hypothetical protein